MTISTDSLIDDFIFNLAKIFEDNEARLGIKEIYKDDVWVVPMVPSMSLSCTSIWNQLRTISSVNVRYEIDIVGSIWYYHSAASPDVTTNLVMRNAYKIVDHIMRNASLNGFLTNTRAIVRSCAYTPRRRSRALISAARILITAPYQTRISTIS